MQLLRDYQQQAHDAVLREWGYAPWWDGERPTSSSTVAALATASGKTLIAAHLSKTLVEQFNARVLFIGDREELLMQPVEKFYKACGIMAGLHRGQDRAAASADVVVAGVQTLVRRLPAGRPFTHIIQDEAHRHVEGRQKIHDAYPQAKRLGITATAFRKNMADLSAWYKTVAFELGTFSLIDEGYLTPIKVLTLPLEVDLSAVKQKSGDFDQQGVSDVLEPHYRAIAKAIKTYAPTRTILAFLPLIQSSKEFVNVLRSEDIDARHCDGGSEDRAGILHDFEKGLFQVLSNSQVFSTGTDFIKCDCLLNLAATRSRGEFRQRAGRIMRLLPGTIDPGGVTLPTAPERKAAIAASVKPDALILDCLWQVNKLGLAGPASLITENEEEEEELREKIKKQRTPEELAELRAAVQRDREEKLRKAIEAAARAAAARNERKATLRDARELMLELHASDLLNFEPAMKGEAGAPIRWHVEKLERVGFDASDLCAGQARKLVDEVDSRQGRGLAPIEAFAQLRAAGCEHPETVTLDDAIRTLGTSFPCTMGKKYHGKPLKDVPRTYWNWLWHGGEPAARKTRATLQARHPAVFRYLSKIVFPPQWATEQFREDGTGALYPVSK